jgi:Asp-tRNA(Asn)/Glu-tRNA(Gln) amidotransferase A subunit family amidase
VTVLSRRSFLGALSVAAVSARPLVGAVQTARMETFSEWLAASRRDRASAAQACLERIRTMDPSIHAWVQVAPQPSLGDGSLAGIPFGAKDIMETRGLATEYGSTIYKGRLGSTDAAIVTSLRKQGAILFGKTHTTAFAYRTPAPTRNPRNLDHTPGGSSSGSAAAVAAGMVPFALGTQTRGSILRPASYCGVTGFKPTYGVISTDGIMEFAKSLDTVGFFTQTAADMVALWRAIGYAQGREEDFALGVPEPLPEVDAAMAQAFQNAVAVLRRAGVSIRTINIAELLRTLEAATSDVMFYEGARVHEQRWKEHGARLLDVADLVEKGLKMSAEHYERATRHIAEGKSRLSDLYKTTPVILVPAATGPAPRGLATTGDARMNAPWTALGTPAISIPMPTPALPVGLQLTAEHGQDARLLQTAVRIQRLLDT